MQIRAINEACICWLNRSSFWQEKRQCCVIVLPFVARTEAHRAILKICFRGGFKLESCVRIPLKLFQILWPREFSWWVAKTGDGWEAKLSSTLFKGQKGKGNYALWKGPISTSLYPKCIWKYCTCQPFSPQNCCLFCKKGRHDNCPDFGLQTIFARSSFIVAWNLCQLEPPIKRSFPTLGPRKREKRVARGERFSEVPKGLPFFSFIPLTSLGTSVTKEEEDGGGDSGEDDGEEEHCLNGSSIFPFSSSSFRLLLLLFFSVLLFLSLLFWSLSSPPSSPCSFSCSILRPFSRMAAGTGAAAAAVCCLLLTGLIW